MCAIAGFIDPSRTLRPAELQSTVLQMIGTLRHRGPDDKGIWADAQIGLALGHRRLAILDLSPLGHQPMHSRDGRYVLVFNGEIYNFRALRRQLEDLGHVFIGHSDTEVMLGAICEWGLESAVHQFVGMFAFALWDRKERTLYLGRDRMGEKPLYYGWSNGVFLFGSELKALRVHPNWEAEIDPESLSVFMRHNYIPAPRSIYRNIFKLRPGTILTLTEGKMAEMRSPEPQPYWSLEKVVESGMHQLFSGELEDAVAELDQRLRESIAGQMIADVPLGAFLSGGIDSSAVVALMQLQSSRPVKTFTIGFEDGNYNEAAFARRVSEHLGTEHTELYVTERELRAVIPSLPRVYDEPFSDTSQIPTVLLCQLARQQVTVSLSGDAGDELFAGYDEYLKTQRAWRLIGKCPQKVRAVSAQLVRRCGRNSTPLLTRLRNLSDALPARTDAEFYETIVSKCREPAKWLGNGRSGRMNLECAPQDLLDRMMFWDSTTYLPDDILVKLDRAAMFVSLETRVPLLDHRIVEFAWRLPAHLKQRNGIGKWILRQVLYRHVPRALVDRPKKGFAVPISEWLRGPLRDWAEALLSADQIENFFDAATVRQKWHEHLNHKRDWGQPLWNVLMFQAWLGTHREAARRLEPSVSTATVCNEELACHS